MVNRNFKIRIAMKYLHVFVLMIFVGLGCSKTAPEIMPNTGQVISKPQVENGYLVFKESDALNIFLNENTNERQKLAQEWEKSGGFVSLYESKRSQSSEDHEIVITREMYQGNYKSYQPIDISIPVLAHLVDSRGIVKIGRSLLFFSSEYTKILVNFKGTEAEIDMLIRESNSVSEQGLYVKKVVLEPVAINDQRARIAGNFNIQKNGNTVAVFNPDNLFQFKNAYTRCRVEGVHTEIPNAWCWDDTEPAMPVIYICGWKTYFEVTAKADFYIEGNGVVASGINISWNTDRGNGSIINQGTICYTGTDQPGGIAYFSIEGNVYFSLLISQPYLSIFSPSAASQYSVASIDL